MVALHRRQMALALLVAALVQPAWALTHAAVHQRLAQHHEEVAHHPAGVPHGHESGTRQVSSAQHEREHDHLVTVFLRPARSGDSPPLVTLLSWAPSAQVVATGQWQNHREAGLSHVRPEASGSSNPRAPPIT